MDGLLDLAASLIPSIGISIPWSTGRGVGGANLSPLFFFLLAQPLSRRIPTSGGFSAARCWRFPLGGGGGNMTVLEMDVSFLLQFILCDCSYNVIFVWLCENHKSLLVVLLTSSFVIFSNGQI